MTKRMIDILSPTDDRTISYSTSIEIMDEHDRTLTAQIRPMNYRGGHEPTIDAIADYLSAILGIKSRRRRSRYTNDIDECGIPHTMAPKEFKKIIKIGESGFVIMFHKTDIRYFLNGMSASKDILLRALARTVYRSCFTNEGIELDKYLYKNIMLPENVSYALENRAPFHWYVNGEKIECRFRVELIADNEAAIEISDGIWCPIKIKDLNIYMGYYWKNNKRGSWKHLSPSRLWEKLLGNYPSEAQKKLMIAFLEQNRTQSLVEERAEQLMDDLATLHSDRIRIFKEQDKKEDRIRTFMIVRGKIADWIITDNTYKSEIQMVSTYIYRNKDKEKSESTQTRYFGEGQLGGPICIDNMTRHSSVGDQFCARALALLNDDMTIQLVNTIKRYLNEEHTLYQKTQRIDFDKLEEYIHGYLS